MGSGKGGWHVTVLLRCLFNFFILSGALISYLLSFLSVGVISSQRGSRAQAGKLDKNHIAMRSTVRLQLAAAHSGAWAWLEWNTTKARQ